MKKFDKGHQNSSRMSLARTKIILVRKKLYSNIMFNKKVLKSLSFLTIFIILSGQVISLPNIPIIQIAEIQPIWERFWGDDEKSDMANYLVSDGTSLYITGMTTNLSSKSTDIIILKYDKEGNELWNKTWGGNNVDWGESITIYQDFIYLTGYTDSYGKGSFDAVVIKFNLIGDEIWNKTWGGYDRDYGTSLIILNSNIYITGYTVIFGNNRYFWQ